MADKKPCDLVKIFVDDNTGALEEKINKWLEENPEFYLDNMRFSIWGGTCYVDKYVICNFCLREDLENKNGDEAVLTNELLKGLIGAVNELSDTMKELTNKKESL